MPATWPGALSKALKRGSFRKESIDTRLKTKMEVGPPKIRRRQTKMEYLVTGEIWVDAAEHDLLESFIDGTLAGGVLTFNFPDGITELDQEYQFEEFPAYRSEGGDIFTASFTLRQV